MYKAQTLNPYFSRCQHTDLGPLPPAGAGGESSGEWEVLDVEGNPASDANANELAAPPPEAAADAPSGAEAAPQESAVRRRTWQRMRHVDVGPR